MRLSFFVTIESSRSVDSIVWYDKIGFMCGFSYSREWNRGPLPVPADAHLRPAYGRPPSLLYGGASGRAERAGGGCATFFVTGEHAEIHQDIIKRMFVGRKPMNAFLHLYGVCEP